ncbi:hypothetical protein ONZ43_g5305 [Nemania bipapillata]|uniref:Uncharacterized protein n=1 Tax=Nemania bipapillata TaxID=110536 RepID=A0ACC2IC95_9PEZI|nr:hypothetical protein ONZ43_g5305 [Nemania bipapillata]
MMYLYAARNFSTLVGLASPEPMANMYDAAYFRATWVLTALDAGFWTAMKIRKKWLRDIASMVFTVFYMVAAERADEKVRKVRGMLTVDHLRVSWNKGTSPYLGALQNLMRPRFTRWPPRAIRIPRPNTSDYKEPVSAWLYYDGPISDLEHINKVILDIPGGGFVAMDPRCNDDKLLAWAGKTGLPVLSLDYHKAPEYPYPYALNECFDVYTTIIKSKGRCIGIPGLAQEELPVPSGLLLFYPALDMNIGNWMSDEQMALIKDRRMRVTNKNYLKRKNMQYNDLVGTPHQSDDEDEYPFPRGPTTKTTDDDPKDQALQSPHPEFSHASPQTWAKSQPSAPVSKQEGQSLSHHPEPMRTRLAMASMISYFNDRVITPEMMRAMIILYIGPHNRPDFSQDYLLSPILAPDALLQRFPKTYFLTGERDPLVDDTVIFAGRLRRIKHACYSRRETQGIEGLEDVADFDDKDVAELVLIPGISHGFMQFPTIYPPAWKFIDRCAQWAEDLLNTADSRERREQRRSRFQRQINTESSGDEDRPLEINMTRLRGRTMSDTAKLKGEEATDKSGDDHEGAQPNGILSKKKRMNGRARGGRGSRSIVKLDSSDDLLSRRMQGLAGALTGLQDED